MDYESPHLPPHLDFETSIPGHFLRTLGPSHLDFSSILTAFPQHNSRLGTFLVIRFSAAWEWHLTKWRGSNGVHSEDSVRLLTQCC
jgi:hypothetical protein